MKKIINSILIIFLVIVGNSCYWIFSDIQEKCVKKIHNNESISLYEKASILGLHMGICTVGSLYCSEAALCNLKMLTSKKDTIYLHSNKWLTPKIKNRFKNGMLGKMSWNGDVDYSFNSPEKNGAILLNWCTLSEEIVDNQLCYTAICDYTWKQPSKTTFKITNNFSITIYEELFYELEKIGLLHPFKLICYYEK